MDGSNLKFYLQSLSILQNPHLQSFIQSNSNLNYGLIKTHGQLQYIINCQSDQSSAM